MGLFDVDSSEVIIRLLKETLRHIESLQEWLDSMKKEVEKALAEEEENKNGRAFSVSWCTIMMEKAINIFNGIARCNGASLVRGTEPGAK